MVVRASRSATDTPQYYSRGFTFCDSAESQRDVLMAGWRLHGVTSFPAVWVYRSMNTSRGTGALRDVDLERAARQAVPDQRGAELVCYLSCCPGPARRALLSCEVAQRNASMARWVPGLSV
jgi:hypothetical protein